MSPASIAFEIVVIGIQFLILVGVCIGMFFGYTWFPFHKLKGWIPVLSIVMIGVSYTIGLIEQHLLVDLLGFYRDRKRGETLKDILPVDSPASPSQDMLPLIVMSGLPQIYKYLNQLHNQCRLLLATTFNVFLGFPLICIYFSFIRLEPYLLMILVVATANVFLGMPLICIYFSFILSEPYLLVILLFLGIAFYFLHHTLGAFYHTFTLRMALAYKMVKKRKEVGNEGLQDREEVVY